MPGSRHDQSTVHRKYDCRVGGNEVQVTLREGESQENLLRRFRSGIQRSGIMQDVKRRRFFVSKSQQARLAQRRAIRRLRRRAAKQAAYRSNTPSR